MDLLVPAGGRGGGRPATLRTADGRAVRRSSTSTSDAPLHDDDGRLVTEEPWGIYVKPDREASRAAPQPLPVGPSSRSTPTRPAPSTPASRTCGARRSRTAWGASRACRAEATARSRSGGAGAFTADNFPVFDHMRPNVYVAADSNHGYKMIAVGREIARVLQRRALVAAAPLPLRALRDRRPAPGLAQPVPVELTAGCRGTWSSAAACRAARPHGAGRARRGRVGAREGPGRRRGLGRRRWDRAQVLPLAARWPRSWPVGRDVRGRARALRLSSDRLLRGRPRAPGGRPRGDRAQHAQVGYDVRARARRRALRGRARLAVARLRRRRRAGGAARAAQRLGRRLRDDPRTRRGARVPPGRGSTKACGSPAWSGRGAGSPA